MTTCKKFRQAKGNPLRRRSDAVEGWAALLLGLLALLMAPASGVAAGWAAHADAAGHARAQMAQRKEVRAKLVEDAPDQVPSQSGVQNTVTYPVKVRWTDEGRGVVVAKAPVAAGLERGDRTSVWLDRQGRVTTEPWGSEAVWARALTAAFLVTLTTATLALLARCLLRRVLDHRRLTAWERDWRRVGPEWSRRHA
ncbi:Rv1733c family protein [Streptomyces fractus]|uniref:Rv1733c family protein n=1 Tax=Streptomyces fractus TaxID=641806 RepID=UPI003CEDE763